MKSSLSVVPRWLMAEFSVFLAIAGAAAGLLAFAQLADGVVEGETHAFDEAVLRAFRAPGDPADPLGPLWLEIVMRDITALGSTTVLTLITAAVVGFLIMDRKAGAALFVVAAVAGGGALSYLLKIGFDRPRPDLVAHLVDVHTLSFPSGHAMGAAVTYLTLAALIVRTERRRRLKAYVLFVAVSLTLLIGLSRIYLGVHWPTDVLAGWCAGSAWALICWLVALWLQRRGQIEKEDGTTQADAKS
ncbi:phosphatase PAP2 family protein [Ancylobacter sp. SL191]|uniref:phosphatase PAP2 family protein n=1 Tax=Ancylobacter sp. SL191 TaxID=2995166 RepID=UPI00226E2096|nr:phosphatase PAP2 family protein [Ancylobacter sp. SL191]WAC25517.1 phosphatase PAP2 family protein [Ancylobacter sp. SL191]